MSYTLVSASVLGFELAGMAAGPTIARTVLLGLTADTVTLLRLATASRPRPNTSRAQIPGIDPTPLIRSLPDRISADTTDRETLQLLRASRLDGAGALGRLIRSEVLGVDCRALRGLPAQSRELIADVLADSALAAWARPEPALPATSPGIALDRCPVGAFPADHRNLGADLEWLLGTLPPITDGDTSTRRAWRAARPSDSLTWTQAMHQACWAAHLTGRVRLAAQAQMRGVLAFHAAGFRPVEVAAGTWTALSGALQALSVLDVLDEESTRTLLTPVSNLTPTAPPFPLH